VAALQRIAEIPSATLGARRTVLLTGISASAQQMWDAVKDKAGGKVRFAPDPALQAIMDAVPKATLSHRSAELGLPHSNSIEEIVREYQATALAT
jgi:nucleoside-diphosphate-sugar epimerase